MNPSHKFNKLLEQYLFKVSEQYIDLADPPTQTGLITFINRVDGGSAAGDTAPLKHTSQPLATEWQAVLDTPVDWQSVHSHWLIGVARRHLLRQDAYIAHIDETIRFTQHQGELIKSKFLKEPLRSAQLDRNKALLEQHQGYLATACLTRQALLNQLSKLV